jgi:hypothetical protein
MKIDVTPYRIRLTSIISLFVSLLVIIGCVKCVIHIIFTRVTRCVKSRCVISPLKGGEILHTLHFDTRRVIVCGLHTTHLHTMEDTNSGYGTRHEYGSFQVYKNKQVTMTL